MVLAGGGLVVRLGQGRQGGGRQRVGPVQKLPLLLFPWVLES